MEIETAIQQYLISLKQSVPREQLETDIVLLARVQEYLEGEETVIDADSLSGEHFRAFIRDWYREDQGATPEIAERIVATLLGWARWLERRGTRPAGSPPISVGLEDLVEALPRTARAAELLKQHVQDEELPEGVEVEQDEGNGGPVGLLSTGLTRVVRVEGVDLLRAEEDTYEVVAVHGESVSLRSATREALGEGLAVPVAVPGRVTNLLCVGDILHVEIAPTVEGWAILNVASIYPGGLDDRP